MRTCLLGVALLLLPALGAGANVMTLYEPTDAEVMSWQTLPPTCGLMADPFGTGEEVLMINPPPKPGGYDTHTATALRTELSDTPLYGTVFVNIAFGTPELSAGSLGMHLNSYYLHAGGTEINNAGVGSHQDVDTPYLFEDPIGWHAYTLAFSGATVATYVDNVLFNETPCEAGFSTVAMLFHGRAYVHDFAYTAQVVPEPSTLMLLGSGLLGIFMRKRAQA